MAIDTMFPIYEILVERIFGSVGLALVGVFFILIFMLILCRASQVFIYFWAIFYGIVMLSFYTGALGLVIGFIFSALYFIYAVIRIWGRVD